MKRLKVRSLILFISVLSGSCQRPAHDTSPMDLIKKSLEYSGDLSDETLDLSIKVICAEGRNRGQSYHPNPPYNAYRIETQFDIDRSSGIEAAHYVNPFNGFIFEWWTIKDAEGAKTYEGLTKAYYKVQSGGFETYRHFPQPFLQSALTDSTKLSYNGLVQEGNESMHLLTIEDDRSTKLFLDKRTLALKKLERDVVHHAYGDGILIKEFSDYRDFDKVKLPGSISSGSTYESWGTLFNTFEVVPAKEKIQIPQSRDFTFLTGDYSPISIIPLSENIYMVRNVTNDKLGVADYNVLLTEFEDFVVVGEAPVSNSTSRRVIALVQEKFPNKPIKSLVQSHHHSDHIGGIREYIARNIEIVATKAHQGLIENIAKGPWTIQPDTLARNPQSPKFKTVEGALTISDDTNEMRIVNIGPIPHVNDMLAVYFPKQQLIWQADMINFEEWPLTLEPSQILRDKIKEYGWSVSTIAGAHGRVLDGSELGAYLED